MFRCCLSVLIETEKIPGGDCSTSAWLTSSLKTYLFALVISLSFSYTVLLDLQQTIFSHARPLLTTLPQLFLEFGRNFYLPCYKGGQSYKVFNVFWVYLLFLIYLSHQLKLTTFNSHILSTY